MRSRISIRGYVRPSVGRSVRPSVRPSVGHTQVDFLGTPIFWLKWNKIAQKHETIPLEGQFRDKYASRSPERIWSLNSVRLVSSICMWSFFSVLQPADPVHCEPTAAKKQAADQNRRRVHKCPYQGCIKVYTRFYVVWIAEVAAILQRAECYVIPF